jgi:hypothetical protein
MENKIDEKQIIDFLYGEMSEQEKKSMQSSIKEDHSLAKDLDGLQSMKDILGKLEDEEMVAPTFVFDSNNTVVPTFFQSNAFRWISSIAAGLTFLLISAAVLQFNMVSTNDGMLLGFGTLQPLPDPELNKENVQQWMAQAMDKYEVETDAKMGTMENKLSSQINSREAANMKVMTSMMNKYTSGTDRLMENYVSQLNEENKDIISNFFTVSSQKQKAYMTNVLADFNEFYQNQRGQDLDMIETHLSRMQDSHESEQLEQGEILASLYDMVNTQNK